MTSTRALRRGWTVLWAGVLLGAGCATTPPPQRSAAPPGAPAPALVPQPATLALHAGDFAVDANTPLVAAGDAQDVARYVAEHALASRGLKLALRETDAPNAITLRLDPAQDAAAGAYTLDVDPHGIRIAAHDTQGLFYGGVTLLQLLTPDGAQGRVRVPALHIADAPAWRWRGLMLDVARHYVPPAEIERLLDTMAQLKLNTFHWHLTDDQGWRLEIKRYPELTRIGAWRTPAGAAGVDDTGQPRRYGGYYTQDEVRAIVRYAAARHITVVPEIEMPGHAQAAIASYPQLGVTGERPRVSADWGIHTSLYNVDDATFEFLENVLGEVIELFPGEYIHVGGDEAAKDQWQASAKIQAQMRALHIADEAHLQAWFVARIERWLGAHGRKLVGWDEILEGGLPSAATVMSWRGTQGAVDAAKLDHDVVLAPGPLLYLDHIQSDLADEPPGRLDAISLTDVYAFEPVPKEIDAAQAHHVLGAQVNVWTEHMRTPERVMHAAFPRAAALAEVLWTPPAQRNRDDFVRRIGVQLDRWRRAGVNAADSAYAVSVATTPADAGRVVVTLSNQARYGTLRYTLDGSAPTAASPAYAQPLTLAPPIALRAAAFDGSLRLSAPRAFDLDAATTIARSSDELALCTNGLGLRLEDDAPYAGPRAVVRADIFDPCWILAGVDLARPSSLRVRVAQLPFNFQLWRDTKNVVVRKAQTPAGELEVHAGSCQGELLARVPLAEAARSATPTEVQANLPPRSGQHALCLTFARPSADPMWGVVRLELRPAN